LKGLMMAVTSFMLWYSRCVAPNRGASNIAPSVPRRRDPVHCIFCGSPAL
jgi:hypothetical protein